MLKGGGRVAVRYSDREIAALLGEKKPLPKNYRTRTRVRDKHGHKGRELDITGEQGTQFRLMLRQSRFNPLDLSVILGVCPEDTNQLFRLRRYNGKSHEHSNKIEGQRFYDFHIHTATERYQELGEDEEAYAEPTDRFSAFDIALRCMLDDCAFVGPHDKQLALLGEIGP